MSGFLWAPGGCCCFGKLDLYEQGTQPVEIGTFYRRSSAVDPGDDTEVSQWSISMTDAGVIRDAVSTWTNQVFEVINDSGTYYLTRYNVATKAVVWRVEIDSTISSTDPMILFAGPDHTGVIQNEAKTEYEIWDSSGTLDHRTGFTAGRGFAPLLSDYASDDVRLGIDPVPQNVSRWNYPACVGWRLTSVSFGTWVPATAGTEQTSCTYTYQLVAGELDWDTDNPPLMSVDEVLEEYTESDDVLGATTASDADKEYEVTRKLARRMNGEAFGANGNGWFAFSNPMDEIGTTVAAIRCNGSSVSPIKDFERLDRSASGVVGYEKHMDGTHGYLRCRESTNDYDVMIDGTVEDTLDMGTVSATPDVPYSFISVPSSSLAFVVTWKSDTDSIVKIRAYENDGTVAWEDEAETPSSRGQVMCASDRYVYLANMGFAEAAKIGANLPDFTAGTKTRVYSGYWCDWAISLDGTRWNPARGPGDGTDYSEKFTATIGIGHVDCIKDSEIPLCPPDDWF